MEGEEKEKLLGDQHSADNGDDDETSPGFGGAKPKVRSSDETPKRKRRVLKKAHSVSHSPQRSLDPGATKRKLSVSAIPNTKSRADTVPLAKSPAKGRCAEFFGVKSYLHTFYEHVSIRNPSLYEDFDDGEGEYRYLISPRKRRRALCWKITLWTGANLLFFGLVMILVGYMVPRREIIVGHDEEMEVVDKTAVKFNSNLDLCKIVGLVVFCVGGTILVGVMLFPSLLNQPVEDGSEEFKVQVGGPDLPPSSPTEKKVPVTEELASIQPKREETEDGLVMTNSGLCKVP